MGMGMITECLQEVGKEPVEIERLNSKDNGVAIDEVVALRRKEVIYIVWTWGGDSWERRDQLLNFGWGAEVVFWAVVWVNYRREGRRKGIMSKEFRKSRIEKVRFI